MIFSLEALQAEHGDSLILHYGDEASPRFIVIDGGPNTVWAKSLKPRLSELKDTWSPAEPLPLQMVMVSHIDDDHINGILDMMEHLIDERDNGNPLPYAIQTLWHNSFDDVVGNGGKEMFASLAAGPLQMSAAAADEQGKLIPPDATTNDDFEAIFASVPQGRSLRKHANGLALVINAPFKPKKKLPRLIRHEPGAAENVVPLGPLSLNVIAPSSERLEALHDKWEESLKKLKAGAVSPQAMMAAYEDASVFNLSSIVVIAMVQGKSMLLTGDARGDHILEGLRTGKISKTPKGHYHFNILKLPHHGSDRNVETDFFRKVQADHYVISANGKHHNPDIATLQMIVAARDDDDFTLHLTNGTGEHGLKAKLDKFFKAQRAEGRQFKVNIREKDEGSVILDLHSPVTY